MATIATAPAKPAPGFQARITFGLEQSTSNYLRAWCTRAPDGSALQGQIEKARLQRVLVYEGEAGVTRPWRTTFDAGGKYTFAFQEYVKGNAWGGGYDGDPRGAPTETKAGSENSRDLYILQRLTQELGAGSDKATLVLFVDDDTIVRTVAAVHGADSPAIIDANTDRAKTAAQVAAVTTALAALVDVEVDTAIGSLGGIVDDFIAKFHDHAGQPALHENVDDQDDLEENYTGATSLGGIAAALNKVRTRLGQHMLNSKENDSTHPEYQLPGGIEIHLEGALRFDLQNTMLPVTADEKSPATIFQGIGDFYRAYDDHRIAPMHDTTSPFFALAALPLLPELHHQFMASLADIAPTAQPGQSSGAATLIGTAGFEET